MLSLSAQHCLHNLSGTIQGMPPSRFHLPVRTILRVANDLGKRHDWAARPTTIAKVVIFFLENHTTDNIASEVAGVNGNTSLAVAPDVAVPDPPHDHGHWDARKTPAPGGARRERSLQPNSRICIS